MDVESDTFRQLLDHVRRDHGRGVVRGELLDREETEWRSSDGGVVPATRAVESGDAEEIDPADLITAVLEPREMHALRQRWTPMTRRRDDASWGRLVLSTMGHWDLWVAVIGAVLFLVGVLVAGDFRGSQPMLIAGVPTNLTIAIAAWLGGRWVADRLRSETYGEVVRLLDPAEEAASLPYHVVSVVAVVAALTCGVAAALFDEVATVLRATLHGGALLLTLWSVLGLASLVTLTFRHQRRIAEIQSLQEEVEHLHRDRGRRDEQR